MAQWDTNQATDLNNKDLIDLLLNFIEYKYISIFVNCLVPMDLYLASSPRDQANSLPITFFGQTSLDCRQPVFPVGEVFVLLAELFDVGLQLRPRLRVISHLCSAGYILI